MNPNNCKNTGIHEPIKLVNGSFQCRWCHKMCTENGVIIEKKNQPFNRDELYAKIVKKYMDDYHYTQDRANMIAEKIVKQQEEFHKQK